MGDQLCLDGLDTPLTAEDEYLSAIKPQLLQVVEDAGCAQEMLKFKSATAPKTSSASYRSVAFGSMTAFRLRLQEKRPYISAPAACAELIRTQWPDVEAKEADGYIRIPVDPQQIDSYTIGLCALVAAAIDRVPKEWDCCSRYQECSDARHCVHPDKTMALSCGYRKILNSGKIYYGVNRNA